MIVTKAHIFTGKNHSLDLNITQDQFERIQLGKEKIQHIVPHLSADEREFLINGMLPGEFDEVFKNCD